MPSNAGADHVSAIAANVPFLRRYARALTGNQTSGDNYAETTLDLGLQGRCIVNSAKDEHTWQFTA